MKDSSKTKSQLIEELSILKKKVDKLERSGSERKHIEETLLESENKFESLVGQTRAGIYIIQDGVFKYVNPQFARMFGYTVKECLNNRSFKSLVYAEDVAKVEEQIGRRMTGEVEFVQYSFRALKKDGQIFHVEIYGSVGIYDGKSASTGTILDITKRKQMEEMLREKEEQYRNFFSTSRDCIFITSVDGRWIDLNDASVQLFGYDSREELMNVQIKDLYANPDDRIQHLLIINEQGYAQEVPFAMRKKDGTVIDTIITSAVRKDSSGRIIAYQGTIRDVTKRKHTENLLRASEERFRSLVEMTSDWIWETDVQGLYTYVSPKIKDILGYEQPEVLGKTSLALMQPAEAERVAKILLQSCKEAKPFIELENLNIHKDGRVVALETSGVPIVDENRHLTGYRGVARDITKRKQTELQKEEALQALRESEDKYRRIAENMSDVVTELDTNGIIKYSSPSRQRVYGENSMEIIGRSSFDIIHPEDRERVITEYRESICTKTDLEVEYRIRHAYGHYIWMRSSGHSFFNAAGKILGMIVTSSDISARKQAELQKAIALEALMKEEEKYRMLIDKIRDGVFIIQDARLIFVNETFSRMTGYPMEEITNMDMRKVIAPEDVARVEDSYYRRLAGENVVNDYEFRILHKDQKTRIYVNMRVNIIDYLGSVATMGMLQDITARKQEEEEKQRLQQLLQHADKMEAIGTLAGGIAHDFNNLLAGILGFTSLSLLEIDPFHPNYEKLKRIEEQVQSGANLTRQLLGFARGEKYEAKPTSMKDILEKTSSMFGRTKKEISIHRKCGENLWNVEVDQGQMEQVFMNLYVNAWQAMPKGGNIYLETENVLLDDEQVLPYDIKSGRYVKITVTDTGTGMDEKTKERIFEPFFTTKKMGRGTGLGLATVYGIIKSYKGMINVYSKPDQGTTFDIYLPASNKEAVKEKTAADRIIKGTETIMLVDDEKMVLEVHKELLESLGYRVYAIGSGQEAIATYMEKGNKIDLVILDMILPGMSGGDTFERLREINPEIRVILCSGYSIDGAAQNIMDRGCNGFIQKPFTLRDLSQKLRNVLDKKK
ncbi:MAG: PAS domain S-box protein [Smithellaceae bacterium]